MGAGKARVLACAGVAALGVALLASGCASGSFSSLAPGQTPQARATPTVSPRAAPGLGPMRYGTFPASTDGVEALAVCEQWATLRDQYVDRLRAETPYQLEGWFSGTAWQAAFQADKPLRADPDFSQIDIAFELVSTGAAASVPNGRLLDTACASAD